MDVHSQLELLELQPGFDYFIVQVDPCDPGVPEHDDGTESLDVPDLAMWLADSALNGRSYTSIYRIHKGMTDWIRSHSLSLVINHGERGVDLMGQAYIFWVLKHPWTPFGLGIFGEDDKPDKDYSMTVLYHGDEFVRDRRGVLTATGQRDEGWPGPREWFRRQRDIDQFIEERDNEC